jgi:hypothetical protein
MIATLRHVDVDGMVKFPLHTLPINDSRVHALIVALCDVVIISAGVSS